MLLCVFFLSAQTATSSKGSPYFFLLFQTAEPDFTDLIKTLVASDARCK